MGADSPAVENWLSTRSELTLFRGGETGDLAETQIAQRVEPHRLGDEDAAVGACCRVLVHPERWSSSSYSESDGVTDALASSSSARPATVGMATAGLTAERWASARCAVQCEHGSRRRQKGWKTTATGTASTAPGDANAA